jgi:hypothetical protein
VIVGAGAATPRPVMWFRLVPGAVARYRAGVLNTPTRFFSRPIVRVGAGAAIASALALFFFAPRFGLWRGLEIPAWYFYPEVNRAIDALKQLQHPFAPIENPSNMVLQWRLLFPLLAHVVALPAWAYLTLPHVGCLLVLGFLMGLLLDRGFEWRAAVAATLLIATCSWFFVSTGWLAYFDSWCMLGLLVVAFSPSRAAAVAAVLATPWIDERFVLALPLGLAVRDTWRATFAPGETPDRRREMIWLAAALLPWALARLGIYFVRSDRVLSAYPRGQAADNAATTVGSYVAGLWHGLRWAWALPLFTLVLVWRTSRPRAAVVLTLLVVTLAVHFVVAADLSRSGSVILPVVVLGVLLMQRHEPTRLWPALVTLCALNLLSPARHVFGNNRGDIFYFYTELENTRHPPPELDARTFNARAQTIVNNGGLPQALELLDAAIRLDPRFASAYSNRAMVHYQLGHTPEAMADVDRALELSPGNLTARYNRGRIRAAMGNFAGAVADLERALGDASATWNLRADAETSLREARANLEKR